MKIGVIGDGLVASIFKELPGYEVVHRDGWEDKLEGWDGVINCAGLTSRLRCMGRPYTEVLEANVLLPKRIADTINGMAKPIPFIQFSSCSVYKRPDSIYHALDEFQPTEPTHEYNASKILMEYVLRDTPTFILRIPRVVTGNGHPSDFDKHSAKWTQVEDLPTTILRSETLLKVVSQLTDRITWSFQRGVHNERAMLYNIATEVIQVPEFIKENYGWQGEVVKANSMSHLGPWPILDTRKAERYGLL